MHAKYRGVVHEAVFEITGRDAEDALVRLPFVDGEDAENMAPAVAVLVNSTEARARCRDLHEALSLYLEDGAHVTGVDRVNSAAAVLNWIEQLRIETRQPVT